MKKNKKMRAFYFYISILFLLMGCSQINTVKKMESDKTISTIFDKSEIKGLAVIVDFFNEQICAAQKNEKTTTITQCYQRFFERMKECEVTGDFDVKIPYREQQQMYSQLSENTFNQVWRIEQSWYRSSRDESDTIEIINIVYIGKYLKFLKEFGKENSVVDLYSDHFEQMGGISPSCVAMVLNEYKQFDVTDIRIQFFIAMHYLTLNDENYRSSTLPEFN